MPHQNRSPIKIAVVQVAPVFLDSSETLKKMENVLRDLRKQACKLVLFPESLLPGYPRGFTFGTSVGRRTDQGRNLWHRYHQASVQVGDEMCQRIGELARQFGINLIIGVTEKDPISSSLYCSMLHFNQLGTLIAKHRKIKPTGAERLIWAEGDGTSIHSVQTSVGRVGGLICWENYMPQARVKLYKSGLDIYLAPTADSRPSWSASMQHIACESRCFVLSCNQYFRKSDYDSELQELLQPDGPEIMCRGGSCIVSPYGEFLAGPMYDREGPLVAEIDLEEVIKSRMDFDPIGHYSRDDIFPHLE